MSRKRNNQTYTTTNRSTVNLCAFWAMAISGFMYIFSGVIRLVISLVKDLDGRTAGILSKIINIGVFIGNIALIIAIAIPAWHYVSGRRKIWKIWYWVLLIFFALGSVLGMLGGVL